MFIKVHLPVPRIFWNLGPSDFECIKDKQQYVSIVTYVTYAILSVDHRNYVRLIVRNTMTFF